MSSSPNSNYAQSVFLQRSKEDTIVADAYGGAKEALSSYSETISATLGSISNEIGKYFKKSSNVKDIAKSVDLDKPLLGLKIEDATKALQGLGVDKGMIDALKNVYNDPNLSNVTSVLAGVTGIKVIGDLGDLYTQVENADLKRINSLLEISRKLTGIDIGIDSVNSMLESVAFVIDVADKWGLTDIAGKIMEKYKDNPRFKQVLSNQLEVYVATANLSMINHCLDNGISPSDARVRCPYAEKMILGAYTIPSNVTLSGYADEGKRLIDTIKRFANAFPKIQVAVSNDQPYYDYDLELFNTTSSQALTVLAASNSIYLPLAMVGRSYRSEDLYSTTCNLYR